MKRRNFLLSAGAAGLLPNLPFSNLAAAAPAPTIAAPTVFTDHTYKWAEIIVRAHNRCNLGLLQRSLQVDEAVAKALKSSLIENGIVHAQANAYGIHKATKPLYEGAFASVGETAQKTVETVVQKASDAVENSVHTDLSDQTDTLDHNSDPDTGAIENDSEILADKDQKGRSEDGRT